MEKAARCTNEARNNADPYPYLVSTSVRPGLTITTAWQLRLIAEFELSNNGKVYLILIFFLDYESLLTCKVSRDIRNIMLAQWLSHADHDWIFSCTSLVCA